MTVVCSIHEVPYYCVGDKYVAGDLHINEIEVSSGLMKELHLNFEIVKEALQ